MTDKEAKTIVEHLVDGTLHSGLLHIDGNECAPPRYHASSFISLRRADILTNISEFAMHGRSTLIDSGYGIVIVRTEQLAIVGMCESYLPVRCL